MAALRADAGYVALAVPAEALPAAEALALEPVKIPWRDEDAVETIRAAAERATALALGRGSAEARSAALVRELLGKLDLPAVVDADALFELEPVEREAPTVLTPHAGSSAACSAVTPSGWMLTGSPRFERPRSASAPSSCSRGRTRSSPRRTARRSSPTTARRRSQRQERATC